MAWIIPAQTDGYLRNPYHASEGSLKLQPEPVQTCPRARRLKLQIPLSYRTRNLGTWSEGTIENISQSGVLFQGPEALPLSLVEMVFEMPEAISGQKKSKVLCQGRIIRSKEGRDPAKLMVLVAAILDYKFLHQD